MINPLKILGSSSNGAARLLIERITGILTEPLRIRRVADAEAYLIKTKAEAEAEAEITKAKSEIEINELQHRAVQRFYLEQMILQTNFENVISSGIGNLNENAKPEDMDNDWLINYLVNCQMISDPEMQKLWGKILAGEANEPGSFSKRTVNYLKDISKSDAELIENLCNFVWIVKDSDIYSTPMILNYRQEIYAKHNIGLWELEYLSDIGIVKLADRLLSTYDPLKMIVGQVNNKPITYHGRELKLEVPQEKSRYKDGKHRISLGIARFTNVGYELSKVCNSKPVEGLYEYVRDQWHKGLE